MLPCHLLKTIIIVYKTLYLKILAEWILSKSSFYSIILIWNRLQDLLVQTNPGAFINLFPSIPASINDVLLKIKPYCIDPLELLKVDMMIMLGEQFYKAAHLAHLYSNSVLIVSYKHKGRQIKATWCLSQLHLSFHVSLCFKTR